MDFGERVFGEEEMGWISLGGSRWVYGDLGEEGGVVINGGKREGVCAGDDGTAATCP